MIKRIFSFLLELVFPKDELTRRLEAMSASEFLSSVPTASETGSFVRSMVSYRDPLVERAIWELKYRGNRRIVRLFGLLLFDVLLEDVAEKSLLENFSEPLLIPIPLSPKRRRERGFNQCELVLDEFEKQSGDFGGTFGGDFEISLTALRKVRHTLPQTSFSKKAERLQNLSGAFAANAPAISGRNIILFDDVYTTGSTLSEARAVLLEAGAKRVIAYTLAH